MPLSDQSCIRPEPAAGCAPSQAEHPADAFPVLAPHEIDRLINKLRYREAVGEQ